MLYSSFDNIPLEKHTFDTMRTYFEREAFFRFMEEGRQGLKQIAEDMVDNFEVNMSHRILGLKGKSIDIVTRKELGKMAAVILCDAFVQSGSKGLRGAVFDVHTIVNNVMRGEPL